MSKESIGPVEITLDAFVYSTDKLQEVGVGALSYSAASSRQLYGEHLDVFGKTASPRSEHSRLSSGIGNAK
jgi:hypothetical protein